MIPRFVITDENGSPYLTRYKLLVLPWVRIYLHHIHRSDSDRCVHDHPWWFWSIVLAGGYVEDIRRADGAMVTQTNRPGRVLFRPSGFAHRIAVLLGRQCWTLVIAGRRRRSWGFFTKHGWMHWTKFLSLGRGRVAWCEEKSS